MRVGEQSHLAEHAKLCFSAPRPSSVACGDSFPQGKLWGLSKSALPQKNDGAYHREGQAPPLRHPGRCGVRADVVIGPYKKLSGR